MRGTYVRPSILAGATLAASAVPAARAVHATDADAQFLTAVAERSLVFATRTMLSRRETTSATSWPRAVRTAAPSVTYCPTYNAVVTG
jgi:hypothetical protein